MKQENITIEDNNLSIDEALEKCRNKEGYIDLNGFLNENEYDTLEETRGTEQRDKIWILYNGKSILLRKGSLTNVGVLYTAEQELITEELAKQVGLNCAHYDIGIRDGNKYSISYNILDEEEYKQNQLIMISLDELIEQLPSHQPNDHTYYIKDAMNAIKNFGKKSNVDIDDIEDVLMNYLKSVIFDCAVGATDRHCQNVGFLYGIDKKTNKPIFEFAPLYDNELSCGSEEPIENVRANMDNYILASNAAKSASPCASVITDNEAFSNKKVDVNARLLNYIVNLDPELYDFFNDCINKMDVMAAITEVENRTHAELPEEYKNQLISNFLPRRRYMMAIKDAIDKNRDDRMRE